MKGLCWAYVWVCVCLGAPVYAQREEPLPEDLKGVGVTEKLGAQVPLDLSLTMSDGTQVFVKDLLKAERPVLLTLNYANCPMLCNLMLDGFVLGLRGVDWPLGREYDVWTVSIDPTETPAVAKKWEQKYHRQYGRAIQGLKEGRGWHFLTGTPEAVRALADAVGFGYKYVDERKEYAHAAAVMVLSPGGRVMRYVYGVEYPPATLRFALLEAAAGRIGSALDQVLMYCYHYDAAKGRYAPVAMKVMRVCGALTLVLLMVFLGFFWLREARKPQAASQQAAS
jgi:protein SCO1/2